MKLWITTLALFAATLSPLTAAENGGLLVDVQKVSLERHDSGYLGETEINRTMGLKINIKNNSMKEVPETTLKYVILLQRWGMETGNIERTQGELKFEKLLASRSVTVNAGEIKIGGHMHGTSDKHVDRIAGWKITIVRDGRVLDFLSNSNFDTLNKRADKKD